jgi:hypothetical protein
MIRGWELTASILTAMTVVACSGGMSQMRPIATGATDKGALTSALDAPIAVGGEVKPAFEYEIPGSTAPPAHLISARSDLIEVRQGLLVGKAPGMTAVLVALDGSETVVDFFHVWVRAADRLVVHGIDAAGNDLGALSEPVELVVGDGMRFVPHPYAGSDRLTGVATSTWTVEPPIAIVLREGLPNRVRLVARQPGSATVNVSMLGAKATLRLQVVQ